MYAQAAIKPNPLLRNGAYGIVMRGVQKCIRGCSSLSGKKAAVMLYQIRHGNRFRVWIR